MQRSHYVTLIAASALAACGAAGSPTQPAPDAAPGSQAVTVRGMVIPSPNPQVSPGILLRGDDGTQIGLQGTQAGAMASLIYDRVEVSGTETPAGALEVASFTVLDKNGLYIFWVPPDSLHSATGM